MRTFRRWVRNNYAEFRVSGRLETIRQELSRKLDGKIDFEKSGGRGQDSIYFVDVDGKRNSVLRLINPFRKQKQLGGNMPYRLPPPSVRLQHEQDCYRKGSLSGLTPRPLWHAEDAILCEYIPLPKLHDRLLSNPEEFWHLVTRASNALAKLHASGLVHMDASLANILADDKLEKFVFIDFEFLPVAALSRQQQIAYDYLRLLESSYKFMPVHLNHKYDGWLEHLKSNSIIDFSLTDLSPLLPALERLVSDEVLWPQIHKIFTGPPLV